jgi:phage terminase small subunit
MLDEIRENPRGMLQQLIERRRATDPNFRTPYLPIVNRQIVLMTRVASELGFTPCSRARIDAVGAPGPVASDWDDLAAG